ncbi:hypothetical protein [Priestia flexa]|uniref:Uncharacterized protein n=1 Tax=Priestia flexa TaxID=86664 RepID=A0ABU4J4F2_9BACI|nr:hypothetical protein [Priestia flexa]MDW8515877.1 hypothetical protein [Priestia flexa]
MVNVTPAPVANTAAPSKPNNCSEIVEPALDCCLLSIHQLVDEIIIIDTGSVDDTVKINVRI